MKRALLVSLAVVGWVVGVADARPNKLFKPEETDGIRTFKGRGVIGNGIFSMKPIGRTDKNPRNLITEITAPADPDDLAFHARLYPPENFGTIIKSIKNKSRDHRIVFEIWLHDGEPSQTVDIEGGLGEIPKWDSLAVDVNHIKELADLKSGEYDLVVWMVMKFDESEPHPDTGVYRFVEEQMYLAKATIKLTKP